MRGGDENMLEIDRLSLLLLAIAALYLGRWCARRLPWLRAWHIPDAVTGGLLGNGVLTAIAAIGGLSWQFETDLRDFLLLAFFCTVGLGARLRLLQAAGRAIALLVGVSVVFLLLQNAIGLSVARVFGVEPVYGLLAGSVAFAGGHGTAIGWGEFLLERVPDALEYGIAAATLGLLLGGLGGGAIARYAIARYRLQGKQAENPAAEALKTPEMSPDWLAATLAIVGCIVAGSWLQGMLLHYDITLPAFLPVTISGVVLGNCLDWLQRPLDSRAVAIWSELSLELFLTMSLIGLQFGALSSRWGLLLAIALMQLLVTLAFSYWAIFPAAGKTYDASVIAAGFVGIGLGATPIGLANMHAVTSRYGAAPRAFVIVPLIWAVFVDLFNAGIVRALLALTGA